jgi:hypothetical protein
MKHREKHNAKNNEKMKTMSKISRNNEKQCKNTVLSVKNIEK